MTLNCRPGDLAVIVRGNNLGALVDVLEKSRVYEPDFWLVAVLGLPIKGLLFNQPVPMTQGNIEDARLRPLRDRPGDDETLIWAGLPQGAGVTQ